MSDVLRTHVTHDVLETVQALRVAKAIEDLR